MADFESDEKWRNRGDHSGSAKPGTAAVLSFVVPGVGQFYNGAFLRGIFWLIATPGLWIWSTGLLGWICHVLSAYTAYRYAQWHVR